MRTAPTLTAALLTAGLVAALPAGAGAKAKKCKGATPYKVGKFCVKQSTYDGTGNVALLVPVRNSRGKITGPGVRIGLHTPIKQTCTDGTSTTLQGINALVSPIAPLKGASFSVTATAGGTKREIRGHYTAKNKVLVELYRQTFPNAAGGACTTEATTVSFTGK